MPADHGLRPDDLHSVQHAGHQPIQPGKYQTVDAAEGQSLRRFTSQHVELMTKRQDLRLQRRSRPEQSDQRQPNQAANISHQPRASPDSTSLASRIEFPTVTGRFERDLLLVSHAAHSPARRIIEPIVVTIIADWWSHVALNEGFALRSPMQCVPKIEVAVAEMRALGLKAAARLLLVLAPAVNASLTANWQQLLRTLAGQATLDS
jgi:hypothetical protein